MLHFFKFTDGASQDPALKTPLVVVDPRSIVVQDYGLFLHKESLEYAESPKHHVRA
jgi:hypothetical protein